MKSNFDNCIRCTICVGNCPVFKVNPEYPGPKQAGPDAERFRLDGRTGVDKWITHCTQCKRCDSACPYGVDPSKLILNAQIRYISSHRRTVPQVLFSNFHYVARLGSIFAPITNFITSSIIIRGLFKLIGLRGDIPFPKFRSKTLQRSGTRDLRTLKSINGSKQRKAAFFHGCYLNSNAPDEGRMIISTLEHLGIEVSIPDQVCCGLPALGNGDLKKARAFAGKNSRVLAEYVQNGWDIIYSCTSCGYTLIYDYPEILHSKTGELVSLNTWNLYEYLLLLRDEGRITFDFKTVNQSVTYHIPCHLRGRGIPYSAVKVFNEVPGLIMRIQDENCCGFSGSFGFKAKNKNTAQALGRIAVESIMLTKPDVIISDCGACRMQIANYTDTVINDPIQILAEALKL